MNYDEARYEAIRARCKVTPAGCWEWQGFRQRNGYGDTSYRGEKWAVHRLMYWLGNGAFSLDRQVCHSCDNRPCCNPAHLWLGDTQANASDVVIKSRHYQSLKTHCPRGHEYPLPKPGLGHKRDCLECQRIRQRAAAKRLKAAPNAPKQFCKQGHPFAGDNLYVSPKGQRLCRTCVRRWRAEHIERLRTASGA